MTRHHIITILLAAAAVALAGCEQVNDDRIPSYPVRLTFNQQTWELYGVHTYGQCQFFDRATGIPAGYFNYAGFDAYTGYGGVILVSGYDFETGNYNSPVAYDRACPYEANRGEALLQFDSQRLDAYCPNCGSRYDVCEGAGIPTAGPAAERNYGLRRYTVRPRNSGGYTISN